MKRPARLQQLRRGTLAATVGAVALTGCDAPPDRTAMEDYSVFAAEATPEDVPQIAYSEDLLADMDIAAEEVRRVGEYHHTDFFAGLVPSEITEQQHSVCFFVLAHELEVAGASCTPDPYDPAQPTVTVRVAGTSGAVQAFLIPDATELEHADGWHRASENVVVVTDPAAQPELAGVVADDTDISLRRITG